LASNEKCLPASDLLAISDSFEAHALNLKVFFKVIWRQLLFWFSQTEPAVVLWWN